ncbi:MAG: YitT family protein [Clostridia bacterium]|nr:YitT family protein [Clostridia bacterium]
MTKENKIFNQIKGMPLMILGCISYALSTIMFLAPNQIIAGGVSGLSVLINYLESRIPIGMISIAINIPIFLLGLKYQGWKFIINSIITVACLGVTTDIFDIFVPMISDNPVLASLYGGILQGIGIGLFVKYEYSSGGTELLGRVISRWTKSRLNIPVCVGILDAAIVLLGSIITNNPSNLLHALIVVFVSTKVSEIVITGLEKSKLCFIITDKGEEISDLLIHNSPRGITMLQGEGMYTKKGHDVLMTCVKKPQLSQLKRLVKQIDSHAFIIINDSVEVRGQGFLDLNKEE